MHRPSSTLRARRDRRNGIPSVTALTNGSLILLSVILHIASDYPRAVVANQATWRCESHILHLSLLRFSQIYSKSLNLSGGALGIRPFLVASFAPLAPDRPPYVLFMELDSPACRMWRRLA